MRILGRIIHVVIATAAVLLIIILFFFNSREQRGRAIMKYFGIAQDCSSIDPLGEGKHIVETASGTTTLRFRWMGDMYLPAEPAEAFLQFDPGIREAFGEEWDLYRVGGMHTDKEDWRWTDPKSSRWRSDEYGSAQTRTVCQEPLWDPFKGPEIGQRFFRVGVVNKPFEVPFGPDLANYKLAFDGYLIARAVRKSSDPEHGTYAEEVDLDIRLNIYAKPIDLLPHYPRWGPIVRIEKLWDYVRILWIYWYLTLAGLLVLAFLLEDVLRRLYYRWRPLPEGRLLLVEEPTKGKAGNINIWHESRRLKKKNLIIGSAKGADILLPGKSVEKKHARLFARRFEGGVGTYIEGLGDGVLEVNGVSESVMPLGDNADVVIGGFRFRYQKLSEYRQVQIRYKSGKVIEGVPASWDIASDGFGLIPSSALSWSDAFFVRFERLKGVYFMQDWDEDFRKKLLKSEKDLHKNPAKLHFTDEEVLPGYLIGKWKEQQPRFYFFPKDQSGDTVYILVERSSVKAVERI